MSATTDTFVQRARRRQLVDCAIASIAEQGEQGASISAIARQAGVSRGVVLYHFGDQAALIEALVEHVYDLGRAEVGGAMDAHSRPADQLDTFVKASLTFYVDHSREIVALGRLFAGGRLVRMDHPEVRAERANVTALLRAGQEAGQFREFDAAVMADSLRGILDSANRTLARDPGALEHLREEIGAHVRYAVAADPLT